MARTNGSQNRERTTASGAGEPRTSGTPLKVTTVTKDMVRYGAAVFACTQGEFVERAVAEYLKRHAELVERRAASVNETAESITNSL